MAKKMTTIDLLLDGATWTPVDAQPDAGNALHATHSGVLEIGGLQIPCWRLSDGRAMIDTVGMARIFGFDSPEGLATAMEQIGKPELAATLRTPTEFRVS